MPSGCLEKSNMLNKVIKSQNIFAKVVYTVVLKLSPIVHLIASRSCAGKNSRPNLLYSIQARK